MTEPTSTLDRRILLADADAFYVQVARLSDPEGAGRASLLIVGGTAEGRGVVTSASYEARAYGIHSAMPTAQALRLCPAATVVPVSRSACALKSRAVLEVLRGFTPVVEPASIDEFYMDLSGTDTLYAGDALEATALRIRAAVHDATGISVSIGGGTTKIVAKLAAKRAKPGTGASGNGAYVVPPGQEVDFMRRHDLAAIPMVGPKFQERLARLGLRTVEDALAHGEATLVTWLGPREGRWLYRRIRGIDEAVVAGSERAKSLGHEETFSRDLETDDQIERELVRIAATAAADLRRKGWQARTVTVKIRDADFVTRQASRTFDAPIAADGPIVRSAKTLLTKLRRARRTPARLLGLSLSQITESEAQAQLEFFGNLAQSPETEHDRKLTKAVDTITSKYGRTSITRGSNLDRPSRS